LQFQERGKRGRGPAVQTEEKFAGITPVIFGVKIHAEIEFVNASFPDVVADPVYSLQVAFPGGPLPDGGWWFHSGSGRRRSKNPVEYSSRRGFPALNPDLIPIQDDEFMGNKKAQRRKTQRVGIVRAKCFQFVFKIVAKETQFPPG